MPLIIIYSKNNCEKITFFEPNEMVILQQTRCFWSDITAPELPIRTESDCVLFGPRRMINVRAKEGQFGNCLLVAQRNASGMDTIEDGLPDESGCASVLAG